MATTANFGIHLLHDQRRAVVRPAQVSATDVDWSRERVRFLEFAPGRRLLRAIRGYQRWRYRWGPVGRAIAACYSLRHRFWQVVCQCEFPLNGTYGGGLLLTHPQGIVVHPRARIGPNCLLFHQVTLGTDGRRPGAPTLGGHVDVGTGAKILGPVTIGDHAKIGANAVVLCDVPPGATAVGIPARIIPARA